MKKITKGLFYGALFFLLIPVSCSEEGDPKPAVLIEATPVLSRSVGELKTFLGASPLEIDPEVLKYDVDIYRIKYKTTYKDSEVVASGLVILPNSTDPVGMLSFQHGTIVEYADAPSALAINDTELVFYAAMASPGFIGVVPDYIGFGESKSIFHPYYVEEATSAAVIDALKAARELARDNDVTFNKRLMLAGYSQGGYATMAAHKYIETEGVDGFDLIASFPAAGGYDVKGMQEYFFSRQTYSEPYYLAYVALSYQSYYDWSNVLGDFFNEPYATRIPTLFNGTTSATSINGQLTTTVSEYIKPDALANINTNPYYNFLVNAFNENSLQHFTPTVKMFMYHGDADVTVPYQNSVSTYDFFIGHGASPNVVTFTTLPGATHGTGVLPYLESFIDIAIDLK